MECRNNVKDNRKDYANLKAILNLDSKDLEKFVKLGNSIADKCLGVGKGVENGDRGRIICHFIGVASNIYKEVGKDLDQAIGNAGIGRNSGIAGLYYSIVNRSWAGDYTLQLENLKDITKEKIEGITRIKNISEFDMDESMQVSTGKSGEWAKTEKDKKGKEDKGKDGGSGGRSW